MAKSAFLNSIVADAEGGFEEFSLLFGSNSSKYLGADELGQLDRCKINASGRRVDEHPFPHGQFPRSSRECRAVI